jgi:ribonuclease HII
MHKLEKEYLDKGYLIAGIDEVGRGSLCNPLTFGIVVYDCEIPGFSKIKDSKKIYSRKKRESLSFYIRQNSQNYDIISINCKRGLNECYKKLRKKVKVFFDSYGKNKKIFLFCDYGIKRFIKNIVPSEEYKSGDSRFFTIASASIIAKVKRDIEIVSLSRLYPKYDWENNVGYGTRKHWDAIRKYGLTPLHRRFIKGIKKYDKI